METLWHDKHFDRLRNLPAILKCAVFVTTIAAVCPIFILEKIERVALQKADLEEEVRSLEEQINGMITWEVILIIQFALEIT